ncbi:YrdB family protein [Streptomyces sp. NPDC051987]|uniref:YrdB family protein n=1 Tax=Streptomyces sp. NPDC051987 TaxID=3155808 RepID=UPI00344694EF
MTLPTSLRVINEGLAFLLEVVALAVLARWGWQAMDTAAARLLLAVAAPAAAAVLWGLFAAPKARIPVRLAGVLTVKVLVFGAAAAALYTMGLHAWAIGFAVVVTANTVLATLDRRSSTRRTTSA